ncbi:PEP-CTERM sorting domain-containing protein [Thermodesulfobacteriota bacterium]
MIRKFVTGLAIGLLLIGMAGMANATLLDFEGAPTGALSGNEYSHLGVLFHSEGGLGVREHNFSYHVSEVLTSNNWSNPLHIDFVNPLNQNEDWTVTSVSMENHFSEDYWIVTAYDLLENLLDTQIVNYQATTISFSGIGNIHSIILDASQTAFGMDNLDFDGLAAPTPAPVPEPTTMLLFSTGLASLVGIRIRHQKK